MTLVISLALTVGVVLMLARVSAMLARLSAMLARVSALPCVFEHLALHSMHQSSFVVILCHWVLLIFSSFGEWPRSPMHKKATVVGLNTGISASGSNLERHFYEPRGGCQITKGHYLRHWPISPVLATSLKNEVTSIMNTSPHSPPPPPKKKKKI